MTSRFRPGDHVKLRAREATSRAGKAWRGVVVRDDQRTGGTVTVRYVPAGSLDGLPVTGDFVRVSLVRAFTR